MGVRIVSSRTREKGRTSFLGAGPLLLRSSHLFERIRSPLDLLKRLGIEYSPPQTPAQGGVRGPASSCSMTTRIGTGSWLTSLEARVVICRTVINDKKRRGFCRS